MGAGVGGGVAVGVVGGGGGEDGGVFGAFGDENDRVEFYAVAHEDHCIAAFEDEIRGDRLKMGRRFAGKSGVFLLLGCDWRLSRNDQHSCASCGRQKFRNCPVVRSAADDASLLIADAQIWFLNNSCEHRLAL